MEMKYDPYYKEEIPYKMTLEDLHEKGTHEGYTSCSERDILAYIRYRGEKFRCRVMSATKGIMSPLGMMCSSDDEEMVLCRLVTEKDGKKYTDSSYNPLIEKDDIREGHWYHSYKLSITPVEFERVIDSWDVSDFCSAINDGQIEIWEMED
jgi:hypothetical protein